MEFTITQSYINNETHLIARGPDKQKTIVPFDETKRSKLQLKQLKEKHIKEHKLPKTGWMSWDYDHNTQMYVHRYTSKRRLDRKPPLVFFNF